MSSNPEALPLRQVAVTRLNVASIAKFDFATVNDPLDKRTYDVSVKSGDTLERIAKLNGTTVETLRKSNSSTNILRPGQSLKYQKASIQKIITRWTAVSTTSVARLYNVGDPLYAKKLAYCLSIMQKEKLSPRISKTEKQGWYIGLRRLRQTAGMPSSRSRSRMRGLYQKPDGKPLDTARSKATKPTNPADTKQKRRTSCRARWYAPQRSKPHVSRIKKKPRHRKAPGLFISPREVTR